MEILIAFVVFGIIACGVYYFVSVEDVEPEVVDTPQNVSLPTGNAPIVRTYDYRGRISDHYRESDDGFFTSMAVAAATDNAMLGVLAGGNVAGALIGDALVDSSPSIDNSCNDNDDNSSNDCSSDSSSDSSSSYDSSSSDSGSSFDSGGGSSGGD